MMEFFRYEDTLYTDGVRVNKRVFELISETPKGYWIKLFSCFNDKKWVSKDGKNRYAYPTEREALVNFKARKTRQIYILETKLSRAKQALGLAPEE
jgi:hypothetical protein